ncbi:hypothetical protein PspLS_08585, partial [Pyricularia sp. CBS 133598]
STWRVHPSVPPNRHSFLLKWVISIYNHNKPFVARMPRPSTHGLGPPRSPSTAHPGSSWAGRKKAQRGLPGHRDNGRATGEDITQFTMFHELMAAIFGQRQKNGRYLERRHLLGYRRLFETLLGAMNTTYHRTTFTTLMSRNDKTTTILRRLSPHEIEKHGSRHATCFLDVACLK